MFSLSPDAWNWTIDVYSQISLLLDQLMFIPRSPCSWTDWCLFPDLPAPGPIELLLVKTDSVSLRWGPPAGLTTPHKFRVTWRSEGDCGRSLIVTGGKVDICELISGEKYDFTVATIMGAGSQSPRVSATQCTGLVWTIWTQYGCHETHMTWFHTVSIHPHECWG